MNDAQHIVYGSFWMVCVVAFSPGSFEMYFHVQIKQSCKSEDLCCFSSVDGTRRGRMGLIYIYNNGLEK